MTRYVHFGRTAAGCAVLPDCASTHMTASSRHMWLKHSLGPWQCRSAARAHPACLLNGNCTKAYQRRLAQWSVAHVLCMEQLLQRHDLLRFLLQRARQPPWIAPPSHWLLCCAFAAACAVLPCVAHRCMMMTSAERTCSAFSCKP